MGITRHKPDGQIHGIAFLYDGPPERGLYPLPSWSATESASNREEFGYATAGVGSVDGDGFDDGWISAPGSLPKRVQSFVVAGKVLLFRGSNEGLMKEPALIIEWYQPNTRFGRAVQSPGDLDQDGTHEIGVIESRFLAADSKSQPSVAPGRLHLFSLERVTSASDPFRVVRRVSLTGIKGISFVGAVLSSPMKFSVYFGRNKKIGSQKDCVGAGMER